jgi:hypothetical protein
MLQTRKAGRIFSAGQIYLALVVFTQRVENFLELSGEKHETI